MSSPGLGVGVSASQTMKRNGKSFWFASIFLPKVTALAAARLYRFCRTMDDLADTAVTPENQEALAIVREHLRQGETSQPLVADFLALVRQYDLSLDVADHLIATFLEDATTKLHVEDERQLVCYCYGVAGTVGLLMMPILGAAGPDARRAAMHLGIAMQMTNIARDVLEDAQNGRRYLPGCWVNGLRAHEIESGLVARELIAQAVARLLGLADQYYDSAASGFALLPPNTRKGIEIAATVYREIGVKLRRRQLTWWQGRVRISRQRKLWLAAKVYLRWSSLDLALGSGSRRAESLQHDAEQLSLPLAGLPGVP